MGILGHGMNQIYDLRLAFAGAFKDPPSHRCGTVSSYFELPAERQPAKAKACKSHEVEVAAIHDGHC